jgi:phosphatidylglycerophosphatase A
MPWYVYVCEGPVFGRLPVAPGTWGSLEGLMLYAAGYPFLPTWVLGGLTVLLLVGSIPVCNWASLYLARKDPDNVILDEIVGQWVALFPLFWAPHWPYTIWSGFLLQFFVFRFYDIFTPFPINHLESLEGGWGIVLDDVLAGVYANVSLLLAGLYLLP